MRVTLFCDASWNPDKRIGAWAVWLKSEQGRIVRKGRCPDYCDNSTTAELAAIFAGLHLAMKYWPDTSEVLVRSDCTSALDSISAMPRGRGMARLHRKISYLRIEHSLAIEPRWVKAHRWTGDVDAYVNDRVDAIARKYMREISR